MAATLTDSQKEEYRAVFQEFDADGSGSISTAEVKALMEKLGQTPTDAEVADYVKEYDTDGDGSIDFDEFCGMMQRQLSGEASQAQLVRESFKLLAVDKPYFTEASLLELFKEMGEPVAPEALSKMVEEADLNKNGQLDIEEFRNVWKQVEAA